ncbi:unnamed protein product [Haemonchus placei]|uniref:Thioredoxin_14 domain-containing protein n=1 Tax=Haemonchus placei TaxID=6290 RepID=A0A158QN52_HAEPC|nr:unnamed protein product [Haemonchus placei]
MVGSCLRVIEPYRTHDTIDPFYIKNWFEANYVDVDYQDVFGPHSSYDEGRTNGRDFLEQSALGDAPKVLLNGYVLDDSGIIVEKFEENLMLEVMRITHELQEAVMQGKLHDRLNVENWIMEQKDVVPRYNKHILRTISQKNILDFTNVFECEIGSSLSDFIRLEESEKTQCITKRMRYIKKTDVDNTMPLTLWIAVDLDTVHGRQMVYNALKFLKRSKKTRIELLRPLPMRVASRALSEHMCENRPPELIIQTLKASSTHSCQPDKIAWGGKASEGVFFTES